MVEGNLSDSDLHAFVRNRAVPLGYVHNWEVAPQTRALCSTIHITPETILATISSIAIDVMLTRRNLQGTHCSNSATSLQDKLIELLSDQSAARTHLQRVHTLLDEEVTISSRAAIYDDDAARETLALYQYARADLRLLQNRLLAAHASCERYIRLLNDRLKEAEL